jgi:hypothetical protein
MLKKIFLIFIGILVPFSIAFAAWELELDWPPSPMGTDLYTDSTLSDLTRYFYEWGIALGGLAAFIAILIAGFQYLTSVGDPQKMADARGRIVWALAGLVLLLASWLILNTINPDLTTLTFKGLAGSCDAVNDCPDPDGTGPLTPADAYECKGDPNPGDGKKEGACVPLESVVTTPEAPPCAYAIAYSQPNFGGRDSSPTLVGNNITIFGDPAISSIKAFFDDSTYNKTCWNAASTQSNCEAVVDSKGKRLCDWNASIDPPKCFQFCGTGGCGCRAELYDTPSCGDQLGKLPAYSSDLRDYFEEDSWYGDGAVDCIKLLKPAY